MLEDRFLKRLRKKARKGGLSVREQFSIILQLAPFLIEFLEPRGLAT